MDENLVEFKKGEFLFKEGEASKDLYILKKGVVKVFRIVEKQTLPIAVVKAGQFIGELSFFDSKPRSASAQAATDTVVIKLDKAKLESEVSKLPSWLLIMIRSIADRMRETNEIIRRNKIVDSKVKDEFDHHDSQS